MTQAHIIPFQPPKRPQTTSMVIHEALRDEILGIKRKPGEAISEKDIAAAYGVSRTPVREAILKLCEERLVEIRPQSGTFVSRIPVDELGEAMLVRAALERTTAGLAATRHGKSDITAIEKTIAAQKSAAAKDDRAGFHSADEAFHQAVATAAGHPGIWQLVQKVKYQLDRYRRLTLPAPGRMAIVIDQHEAVLAGIGSGSKAKAEAAMDTHLQALIAFADEAFIDPSYLLRGTMPRKAV